MDTAVKTFKQGQAPWEVNNASPSFVAGKAPWEVSPTQDVALEQRSFSGLPSAIQNSESPGIDPTFKASTGGNPVADVIKNTVKTGINIPSSAANLVDASIIQPVSNLGQSINTVADIYKQRDFLQGTKDILSGFADTYKKTGQAIVDRGNEADTIKQLAPIQDEAVRQRDEILQRIKDKRVAGEDTSHLQSALKYNVENIKLLDDQIGTKEDRTNQELDTLMSLAKVGIERPTDIPAALYGGEGATGKDIISATASPITRGVDTSISGIASKIVPAITDRAITQAAEDWSKLGNDYVKSSKILAKGEIAGKDTPQFLADRGYTPQSTQGQGERIALADQITKEDTRPFEDVLQKTLQEMDLGTEKLALSGIKDKAIANVANIKGITALDAERITQDIADEFGALERKYKDGKISLSDINKEKRTFWQNTKFDSTKPFKGDVNYQIGNALKSTIEENVSDVNIKELNNILAQHYDAGKFLNSIDSKVGKATTAQKIKKGIVRVASTAIGHAVGGTAGGITGFVLTDTINAALSKASNPLKTFFLNRLKNTDPEIYAEYVKGLKFLDKQEAERASRLALPEPSPLGSEKNPIITPAPTTYERGAQKINKIDSIPEQLLLNEGNPIPKAPIILPQAEPKMTAPRAKKGLLVQDPKTGKYKKVYTSQ